MSPKDVTETEAWRHFAVPAALLLRCDTTCWGGTWVEEVVVARSLSHATPAQLGVIQRLTHRGLLANG